MPPRSNIVQLPDDLRAELNARLVANGFSDYSGLEEWLNEELEKRDLEFRIYRSVIHRHGQKFEEKLEKMRMATEQARAISEGSQDDEGTMNDALIRMVQTLTFNVMYELGEEGKDIDPAVLHKIGVMIARITRASVKQKEWMLEIRDKLNASKQSAIEKSEAVARRAGLSDEAWEEIRSNFLGVKIDGS